MPLLTALRSKLNRNRSRILLPSKLEEQSQETDRQTHLILSIPELLHPIFSQLDQKSILSVRLVCQLWNLIARDYISLLAQWQDNMSEHQKESIIKRLMTSDALEIVEGDDSWTRSSDNHNQDVLDDSHNPDAPKDLLLDFLLECMMTRDTTLHFMEEDNTGELERVTLSTCRQNRLRKLVLLRSQDIGTRLQNLLGALPMLTSLELVGVISCKVEMYDILRAAPNMKSLVVEYALSGELSWTPLALSNTEYAIPTATSIVENSPRLSFHHNLESLKMRHVHIDQNSLEALCSALPFLLRLEVRFLRLSSSPNPGHFNRQEFYRSLARYCPRIESLHFSLFHRKLTVVDSTVLQHSFPTLKELSMAGKDLDDPSYGYRIKLLEYYANHLTKLEILCYTQIQGNQFLERLHQFLCTARHLQHLIAPKVKYWSEYLDLEEGKDVENDEDDEIYYIARNVRESQEWRIPTWRWACQDLETLHLGFTARFGSSTNAEHSRVIFGYLSRYCPNLKDLHISKNMLNLHIDGGLCLLTRLKYLEKLTISSHTVYFDLIPSDINWIGYLANQILTVADTNSLDAEEVPAAKGKKNKAVNYFKSLVPIRRKKATLASSIQLVKTIEDVFAMDKKWNEKRKEHRVSTVFASQLNEYDEFLSDATSESQYRFWRHLRSFVLGVNPAHLFKDSKDGNLIQEMRPDINFKVQQWTNDT